MAVSTLALQGEDKYTRHAYARRQDEIYFNNKTMYLKEQAELKAERLEAEIEKLRREIEVLRATHNA